MRIYPYKYSYSRMNMYCDWIKILIIAWFWMRAIKHVFHIYYLLNFLLAFAKLQMSYIAS